jgi:RNA polymerase sigma-70 factor (ECF subfamily)
VESKLAHSIPLLMASGAPSRESGLRSMVEHHFDSVWRALRRLGVPESVAADAAQQVFIVALRRFDEIDPERARAYLLGVAVRVASEARRAALRRREVSLDEDLVGPVETQLPDALLEEKCAREALTRALDTLSQELREAFVLFELEELSAPEVARLLRIPVGTVASRVRRARAAIRSALAPRGVEP